MERGGLSTRPLLSNNGDFPASGLAVGADQVEVNSRSHILAGVVGEVPGSAGARGRQRFYPVRRNRENLDSAVGRQLIKRHWDALMLVDSPGIRIHPHAR